MFSKRKYKLIERHEKEQYIKLLDAIATKQKEYRLTYEKNANIVEISPYHFYLLTEYSNIVSDFCRKIFGMDVRINTFIENFKDIRCYFKGENN